MTETTATDTPGAKRPRGWQKGQSGNPKGRPKGDICLTTHIKRVLAEVCEDPKADGRTYAELFARALIANAIKGNGPAIKEILNRVDGVTKQTIDLALRTHEQALTELELLDARPGDPGAEG